MICALFSFRFVRLSALLLGTTLAISALAYPPDEQTWLNQLGAPDGFPPAPEFRYPSDNARTAAVSAVTLRYSTIQTTGIDFDSPWAQMGRGGRLEKCGAVLQTTPGQMALLKTSPTGGIYRAINPFIDPVDFEFTTPNGIVVKSDGPLGLARITVEALTGNLRVDCAVPTGSGDIGAEWLQDEVRQGVSAQGYAYNTRQLDWFYRPGLDVHQANQNSARFLLVRGLASPPSLTLNGNVSLGGVKTVERDGYTWWRLRIAADAQPGSLLIFK